MSSLKHGQLGIPVNIPGEETVGSERAGKSIDIYFFLRS